MGRARGTVKSDKAEAKHKLRQRARKIAFDPKKHALSDEEFDWGEFSYYVGDVLSTGSRPMPASDHNLSEGYRAWLEKHMQWLEQNRPEEAEMQRAWDKMLAEKHHKERDAMLARRKPIAGRKRQSSFNRVTDVRKHS
jgi:hypothetical protein